ncbi:hypothetical protein SAY86_002550 [Trapa natans]|uniref:Uncharacterized protein n=1 Tax=Trapa natans TaxID=22666 RepID=A0AAN7LG49_TRANT|nr:hypothetical protein SAY86_002550 [Trapa natans]
MFKLKCIQRKPVDPKDENGTDGTVYGLKFRDTITKHDTISGYLFNITFLRTTGPYDITTRWTMVMKFIPLPWKPEKDMNNFPDRSKEGISLRKVEGGIASVLKFSCNPWERMVLEKVIKLGKSLERDGLKTNIGCLLARYNDP